MSLPRFDFAPHEWPPLGIGPREGLADAVFKVVWNNERVEVMTRWVELEHRAAYLFFKAIGGGPTLVVSREHSYGTSPFANVGMKGNSKVRLPVELVQKALRGWGLSYGHGFCFPAQTWHTRHPQWLFLRHDGSGGVWNDWHYELHITPFRLSPPLDFSRQALEDPDSPIRFALDWSQLSHEQRLEQTCGVFNDKQSELHKVVQSIALSEPSLHRTEAIGRLYYGEKLWPTVKTPHGWEGETPNARLRRWSVHLQRAFNWKKDEELTARHLCVERFNAWPRVQIELSPPTHHERLEAALFLREWAAGKIPSDELRLLLPKL